MGTKHIRDLWDAVAIREGVISADDFDRDIAPTLIGGRTSRSMAYDDLFTRVETILAASAPGARVAIDVDDDNIGRALHSALRNRQRRGRFTNLNWASRSQVAYLWLDTEEAR